MAAQIAVQQGARVIGSASAANRGYLRSIAVEPVLYVDHLVRDVRAIVPDGVDAIFDCVGTGFWRSTLSWAALDCVPAQSPTAPLV